MKTFSAKGTGRRMKRMKKRTSKLEEKTPKNDIIVKLFYALKIKQYKKSQLKKAGKIENAPSKEK